MTKDNCKITCMQCGKDLSNAEGYKHSYIDDFGIEHIVYAKICITDETNFDKHLAGCLKVIQPYCKPLE